MKGFIEQRQNRNFTTVSFDRHARSYERVAFPQAFSGPWRSPPNYLSKVLSKVLSKALSKVLSKVSKLSKLVKQVSKASQ